jgi:hypothetical protein
LLPTSEGFNRPTVLIKVRKLNLMSDVANIEIRVVNPSAALFSPHIHENGMPQEKIRTLALQVPGSVRIILDMNCAYSVWMVLPRLVQVQGWWGRVGLLDPDKRKPCRSRDVTTTVTKINAGITGFNCDKPGSRISLELR